jgi:hypothetical protein
MILVVEASLGRCAILHQAGSLLRVLFRSAGSVSLGIESLGDASLRGLWGLGCIASGRRYRPDHHRSLTSVRLLTEPRSLR